MNILVETKIGVIPLPIEITKLGADSMANLEQSLFDSFKYISEVFEKEKKDKKELTEEEIMSRTIEALQEATKAFINRLKHKEVPLLLVPK